MNYKRPSKDEYYLGIALAVSKRSTCLRRRYGCVIVKNDIIVSTGYNGAPRSEPNCCDIGKCYRADSVRYCNYEACKSVHAEQNAIIAASHDELLGATVYLACEELVNGIEELSVVWLEDLNPAPCGICSRILQNARVSRIVNRKGEINGYLR